MAALAERLGAFGGGEGENGFDVGREFSGIDQTGEFRQLAGV